MSAYPKQVDDLAAIIAQSDFAEECAELVIAAGYVSPEEHRAEVEAERAAWIKADTRAEKAEAEVDTSRRIIDGLRAEVTHLEGVKDDLNDEIVDCKVLEHEATIARVEALADRWDRDGDSWSYVEAICAALAEPERDEEPCSCGSRDATSLTPGEWLHHSPDGCTIERDEESGR